MVDYGAFLRLRSNPFGPQDNCVQVSLQHVLSIDARKGCETAVPHEAAIHVSLNKCWWCGYGSNTYSNSPLHLQVRGIPIRFWLHMLVKFLPRMCRFGNGSGARVVFVAATFSFLDFLSQWNRMVDVPAVFFCWVHNFFCFWHVRKDGVLSSWMLPSRLCTSWRCCPK